MYGKKIMKKVNKYCDDALYKGNVTYGDDYLYKPLGKDLVEEARDIVNYGRLFLCRIFEMNKSFNDAGNLIKLLKTKNKKDLKYIHKKIGEMIR